MPEHLMNNYRIDIYTKYFNRQTPEYLKKLIV